MLMVFDRDTFTIHMLYFPHVSKHLLGSLRKDQTHLATTCFGVLIHHPIAHIGTIGITYWDSNPYLPDLESGVLPIKLRLHILAGRVGLEPTTSRLTADCSTIELPTHTCQRTVRNLCAEKYNCIEHNGTRTHNPTSLVVLCQLSYASIKIVTLPLHHSCDLLIFVFLIACQS